MPKIHNIILLIRNSEIQNSYRKYLERQSLGVEGLMHGIPVLDLDHLLSTDRGSISFLDQGSHSAVFKLKGVFTVEATLKIMGDSLDRVEYLLQLEDDEEEKVLTDDELWHSPDFARKVCVEAAGERTRALTLAQIEGHALGAKIAPQYVDSPLGIWTSQSTEGQSVIVGYSLPFVEGDPMEICYDYVLMTVGDDLRSANIYVGSRMGSKNAVINWQSGVKKFIDVQVRK